MQNSISDEAFYTGLSQLYWFGRSRCDTASENASFGCDGQVGVLNDRMTIILSITDTEGWIVLDRRGWMEEHVMDIFQIRIQSQILSH